jgi:hypothetical protein
MCPKHPTQRFLISLCSVEMGTLRSQNDQETLALSLKTQAPSIGPLLEWKRQLLW